MACIFCSLIACDEARWVAKTQQAVAFLPLDEACLAPGHTLVIPRAHHLSVLDTPPALLSATIALVQRVALAMQTALDADGVVILNASGGSSGQSVFHLHFHVVPRWQEPDGTTMWPTKTSTKQLQGPLHALIAAALGEEGT